MYPEECKDKKNKIRAKVSNFKILLNAKQLLEETHLVKFLEYLEIRSVFINNN